MNAVHMKVTGKMIKEKALEISIQLGMYKFPASNGWLDNFRKRYSLSKNNEVGLGYQKRKASIQNDPACAISFDSEITTEEPMPSTKKSRIMKIEPEEIVEEELVPEEEYHRLDEDDETSQEEMVEPELIPDYVECREVTKQDARNALQVLISYFHSNTPVGTLLALQTLGEQLGMDQQDEDIVEEMVELDRCENVLQEVEIHENRWH